MMDLNLIEKKLQESRLATLLVAVEFGFRCHEKGQNLQMAIDEAKRILDPLYTTSQAQTSPNARNAGEEKL